jgi:hypothetical protein
MTVILKKEARRLTFKVVIEKFSWEFENYTGPLSTVTVIVSLS